MSAGSAIARDEMRRAAAADLTSAASTLVSVSRVAADAFTEQEREHLMNAAQFLRLAVLSLRGEQRDEH